MRSSDGGSVTGSRGGMVAKIFEVQNKFFGVGKSQLLVLVLQSAVFAAALIGVAGLRNHYTSHGFMLLKMRNVM